LCVGGRYYRIVLFGSNQARETFTEVPDDFSQPAVELCGISKRFGSRVILDSIELQVARGEVLALVGPSGSGKSTLMHIVSGIETADAGRVLLDGRDCTAAPPYRRPVHTVFQHYALFPHLDVAGNVGFPLTVSGVARAERERLVSEALDWVKIRQHARRRIDGLSGGERQRVALARALVDSPTCVLLDEPLSALDPHLRAETLELLQSIQTRLATTFLFVTHDRDEAMRIGHRIGVLNEGRLEQIGPPEELYRQPRTAFVASFLGKINWLAGEHAEHDGEPAVVIAGQRVPCPPRRGALCATVRVGVRPEDAHVSADGPLEAEVICRQFLGDSTLVRVRLRSGEILTLDERGGSQHAKPGEQVRLGWRADAAHLFPAEKPA
jgi:ABC-type Fe3+/spermidine/putrescine transport system ATPase subunit